MKQRYPGLHLAERLEHETDLFPTREENEDFGVEVCLDKGPENVKFSVERTYTVVL